MKVQNTQVLVTIAVPFDREIDNINERARNTMIGIGLLALAMVAGIGYWAINNTFRPLRDIEKTASRIAGGDLSQRVPTFPATRSSVGSRRRSTPCSDGSRIRSTARPAPRSGSGSSSPTPRTSAHPARDDPRVCRALPAGRDHEA